MPVDVLTSPLPSIDQEYRPKLREGLRIGPEQHEEFRTVSYVKDTATGRFFRIGLKEGILLARIDGTRSLAELRERYVEDTGRRLSENEWNQLLLAVARFLEELPGQIISSSAPTEAPRGFLEFRFPLANPDRFLNALLPSTLFAFRRPLVMTMLLLMLATQVWIWLHAKQIFVTAFSFPLASWWLVAYIGLFLIFAAVHEIAHGLACNYFGGSVQQMGIMFRYLTLMPYCKLDDVVLFHNWQHRIYVMFAGSYSSLVLLFPFVGLWFMTDPGTGPHYLSAAFLSFYNVTILFNLIPFIQLDGYFMLCYHLRLPTLRKDAHEYCMNAVKRACGRSHRRFATTPREASLLASYGLLSAAFTVMILVQALRFWHSLLAPRIGSWPAILFLCALMSTIILWRKRAWFRSILSGRVSQQRQT